MQASIPHCEATGYRDVGAQGAHSDTRRHLQRLAFQMDELHQGIPAAMVRSEQWVAVILQVRKDMIRIVLVKNKLSGRFTM